MQWWIWALIGLALLVLEVATPGGCFLLFFGAGALFVALLAASSIAANLSLQILIFTVASVVSLVLFRNRLLQRLKPNAKDANVDRIIGELGTAEQDIAPGALGKIQLRGTLWTGKNVGTRLLTSGAACRVSNVDGLTVWVNPES